MTWLTVFSSMFRSNWELRSWRSGLFWQFRYGWELKIQTWGEQSYDKWCTQIVADMLCFDRGKTSMPLVGNHQLCRFSFPSAMLAQSKIEKWEKVACQFTCFVYARSLTCLRWPIAKKALRSRCTANLSRSVNFFLSGQDYWLSELHVFNFQMWPKKWGIFRATFLMQIELPDWSSSLSHTSTAAQGARSWETYPLESCGSW